jgi:hypothetical protein
MEGGIEVVACDCDILVRIAIAIANSILHAKHRRSLAEIGDVGAGKPLGRAGQLGGEPVRRELRVEL